ncbi:MAG: chromosome segregation protein SMC [Pirellulaceae bacterium]
MLKALEIAGFKSFADRTRFEFPPGITVVVGPNGSGKSNIVDAIKWVLGEQSAKSLRGKDMADVIFKGSGNSGRKMMNTAEATIIFDNSEGRLPVDAPEVHVTRRVYRSGEGEYLINRQPCRLKDIRDMFRGTGVGTDAYSLIEQGKVDRMLQASPKDRRAMFEEAAGISRFKAKKVEAQRRLERVDQNLLRLSDIVEEVHNRLKSVRSQAGKAKRYREYSDRLQQLRTQVGLTDWRRLSDELAGIEAELTRLNEETATLTAEADEREQQVRQFEMAMLDVGEAVRDCEQRASSNREQIAAREATVAHELARMHDLEQEQGRYRSQLTALNARAGELQAKVRAAREQLDGADAEYQAVLGRLSEHERELAEVAGQLAELRSAHETRRTDYVDAMRSAATLGNQLSRFQTDVAAAEENTQRLATRQDEAQATLTDHRKQLDSLEGVDAKLAAEAEEKLEQLDAAQRELAENRRVLARRHEEVAQRQGKLHGARERAAVLEELEQRQEGLSAGVKELLARSHSENASPWNQVKGVVADLIRADVSVAAMIDVALGGRAQHVVLAGDDLLEQLRDGQLTLAGRVGMLRLSTIRRGLDVFRPRLDGLPGVIDRADRLVEAEPQYAGLVHRLLGATWCVETLDDAMKYGQTFGQGLRFVTADGDLIEADGSLQVGPQHAAVGLVARRSELRAIHRDIADLEAWLGQAEAEVRRLAENIDEQEHRVRKLDDTHRKLTTQLSDHRVSVRTLRDRCDQLEKQLEVAAAELAAARVQKQTAEQGVASMRTQLTEVEATIAELEAALHDDDEQLDQLDSRRRDLIRETSAGKVELAKSQQHVDSIRAQVAQFEQDQRERAGAIRETRQHLQEAFDRAARSQLAALDATSALSLLFLQKEQLAADARRHLHRRQEITRERTAITDEAAKIRKRLKRLEDELHQQELSANELRHQRTTLAERLRDDYGIDITKHQNETSTEEVSEEEARERREIEEEIADLRRKINSIGAVNMDALNELDDLESRYNALAGQYEDLTKAKESLERIIQKINADSRRLFMETLEAIRTNFQTLYRKAFGGGKADIVLEAGEDVLECGIDIMATPPGKPSFNNSLLSGGEKALTAVALLLAIFEFRPSPFCVLDEVDAPFDEANIGRFVDVLKGFLGWTKFVIVTHSKKTMTAATTLYGVTMQESGVSKKVSVRFEDVSEDGHISQEALEREPTTPAAPDSDDDEQAA